MEASNFSDGVSVSAIFVSFPVSLAFFWLPSLVRAKSPQLRTSALALLVLHPCSGMSDPSPQTHYVTNDSAGALSHNHIVFVYSLFWASSLLLQPFLSGKHGLF